MAELAKPYELLELQDGQSVAFSVLRFERGETTIYPGHKPEGKRINVLRVHVPVSDKPTFPSYYDLTSERLIAQLGAELARPDVSRLRFRITARGIPPKRTFEVVRTVA